MLSNNCFSGSIYNFWSSNSMRLDQLSACSRNARAKLLKHGDTLPEWHGYIWNGSRIVYFSHFSTITMSFSFQPWLFNQFSERKQFYSSAAILKIFNYNLIENAHVACSVPFNSYSSLRIITLQASEFIYS